MIDPRLKRHWLWLSAAMLLVGMIVAACAPAGPTPPAAERPKAAPPGPEAAAKAKPQYGGVLQFYNNDAPMNLDPYADTSFFFSQAFLGTVYENLVNYNTDVPNYDYRVDLGIIPWLAEKWEMPNETTYVFYLRDAKFHDGTSVTADDVVWSLEYLRDPKNAFGYSGNLTFADKITKLDEKRVQITTKGVAAFFLSDLASRGTVITPKHVFDEGGAEAIATKGIGSGPFKLKKFDRKGKSEMVRFESYWKVDEFGQRMPYLDGFQITHNMDQAAVQAALAARKIDISQLPNKASADALKRQVPDLVMEPFISDNSMVLMFNMRRKPWDDLRVRQAVNLALDRWEMIEAVTFSMGLLVAPPPSISTKTGWGVSQEELAKLPGFRKDKTEDLKEAKRLLAEAGYPSGLKAQLIYTKTWVGAPAAEFTPTSLARAGIQVELVGQDGPTNEKEGRAGNYELWLRVTANAALITYTAQYYAVNAASGNGWNNKEYDDLLKRLQATIDKEQQKKIVRQMQEVFLKELPSLTLVDMAVYKVYQPWVNSWRTQFGNQPTVYYGGPYIWFDMAKLPDSRKAERP